MTEGRFFCCPAPERKIGREIPDLLYASGKLFGGIYNDRFLVKDTPAARAVLSIVEVPYESAAPMLLVDVEDSETIAAMVESMFSELPELKKRKR